MANQVYANDMEVSCKAAAGKSICAFPDICFTPPQTPATPPGVPIPYPNTGMASDTTDGSSTVKISGQEVMLKNKSYFKRSMGDEAGCAPKKGVVSSKNMGKVYFIAWSMDVMAEGENVVRMMDMTTHNHASQGPNAPPMVYFDEVAIAVPEVCREQAEKCNKACAGATKRPKRRRKPKKGKPGVLVDDGLDCSPECAAQQKCILIPKDLDKKACCHPDTTGHHMIEDHWIKGNSEFDWYRSNRGNKSFPAQSLAISPQDRDAGVRTVNDAPCVCGPASRSEGDHQEMHNVQAAFEESYLPGGVRHNPNHPSYGFTYGAGKNATLNAHDASYSSERQPDDQCDRACLEAQLDAFYGDDSERPLNRPKSLQPVGESREPTNHNWDGVVRGPGR
jgi:Domain of unknown function (DUF4150)